MDTTTIGAARARAHAGAHMQVHLRHIKQAPKGMWRSASALREQFEPMRFLRQRPSDRTHTACNSQDKGKRLSSGTCSQNPLYDDVRGNQCATVAPDISGDLKSCMRKTAGRRTIHAPHESNVTVPGKAFRLHQAMCPDALLTAERADDSIEASEQALTDFERRRQRDRWRHRWDMQLHGYSQASAL
jgi:hypothetical protein